jgi:hypothetical protein
MYIRATTLTQSHVQLTDGPALAMLRQLRERKPIVTRPVRGNEYASIAEVGVAGTVGYIFVRMSQPGLRLSLVPPAVAMREAARDASWRRAKPRPRSSNARDRRRAAVVYIR